MILTRCQEARKGLPSATGRPTHAPTRCLCFQETVATNPLEGQLLWPRPPSTLAIPRRRRPAISHRADDDVEVPGPDDSLAPNAVATSSGTCCGCGLRPRSWSSATNHGRLTSCLIRTADRIGNRYGLGPPLIASQGRWGNGGAPTLIH